MKKYLNVLLIMVMFMPCLVQAEGFEEKWKIISDYNLNSNSFGSGSSNIKYINDKYFEYDYNVIDTSTGAVVHYSELSDFEQTSLFTSSHEYNGMSYYLETSYDDRKTALMMCDSSIKDCYSKFTIDYYTYSHEYYYDDDGLFFIDDDKLFKYNNGVEEKQYDLSTDYSYCSQILKTDKNDSDHIYVIIPDGYNVDVLKINKSDLSLSKKDSYRLGDYYSYYSNDSLFIDNNSLLILDEREAGTSRYLLRDFKGNLLDSFEITGKVFSFVANEKYVAISGYTYDSSTDRSKNFYTLIDLKDKNHTTRILDFGLPDENNRDSVVSGLWLRDNSIYMVAISANLKVGYSSSRGDAIMMLKLQYQNKTYEITNNVSGKGTVNVVKVAEEGEIVPISAIADTGYKLSSIVVTDSDGNEIEINDNAFVMPASNVTISTKFSLAIITNPKTGIPSVGGLLIICIYGLYVLNKKHKKISLFKKI